MNNSLQSSFSNEFLIKIIQMTQTSTEHTKCPNSTTSLIFKRKFYHEKSTKEMFNITCKWSAKLVTIMCETSKFTTLILSLIMLSCFYEPLHYQAVQIFASIYASKFKIQMA